MHLHVQCWRYPCHCVLYWDLYSVQIYTGKPPFTEIREEDTVTLAVMQGKQPERPNEMRREPWMNHIWQMLEECWTEDSYCRPHAQEIVQRLESVSVTMLSQCETHQSKLSQQKISIQGVVGSALGDIALNCLSHDLPPLPETHPSTIPSFPSHQSRSNGLSSQPQRPLAYSQSKQLRMLRRQHLCTQKLSQSYSNQCLLPNFPLTSPSSFDSSASHFWVTPSGFKDKTDKLSHSETDEFNCFETDESSPFILVRAMINGKVKKVPVGCSSWSNQGRYTNVWPTSAIRSTQGLG